MISLHDALLQSTWADRKLFAYLSTLPDEAWRARSGPDEWDVTALTFHLVASADWYRYQLGGDLQFHKDPESIAEVRALGATWEEINSYLLAESLKDDEVLSYTEDGETFYEKRSHVLTQVIVHSVEHRVHIAVALKAAGYRDLDLEDYSVWGFRERINPTK